MKKYILLLLLPSCSNAELGKCISDKKELETILSVYNQSKRDASVSKSLPDASSCQLKKVVVYKDECCQQLRKRTELLDQCFSVLKKSEDFVVECKEYANVIRKCNERLQKCEKNNGN